MTITKLSNIATPGGMPEKSKAIAKESTIVDSVTLEARSSSLIDRIRKGINLVKEAVNGGNESGKIPDNTDAVEIAAGDEAKLTHPDIYRKLKELKEAGFTFFVRPYKKPEIPAQFRDVYLSYAENSRSLDGVLAAKREQHSIDLPYSEEDLQLLSYFYCGSDGSSLKNPDIASALKKVYDSGNTFSDRYLEKCFTHRETNPIWTYSRAVKLRDERDAQSDLHFKDGDRFFQIESIRDFKRACVLCGAMKDSDLSPHEREALPILRDMMNSGAVFTERYGDTKVGSLALLRAVGEGFPSVMFIDERGSRNEVKALKDLKRLYELYYKKDLGDMDPGEKKLVALAGELLDAGMKFTDLSLSEKPYGAAMIAKAALQEDRSICPESVYFKDELGQLMEINRPEDLTRIKAIHNDKDISTLPSGEQKILQSLERIFDPKGGFTSRTRMGQLGGLKGILNESYPLTIKMSEGDRPPCETIRSLQDVDRFVALYINNDLSTLPRDEREAFTIIKALGEKGVKFQDDHTEPLRYLNCMQILKKEDPQLGEVRLDGKERSRMNTLEDLKRLDALWLKNDLSLLKSDEEQMVLQMRDLRAKGMRFKGYYDESELTILKGIKGELGKAFVAHKSRNESVLDDPMDFTRLDALYVSGDLSRLPAAEREIAGTINFMKDQGYYCALVYNGRTEYVEPFDVLKSAIKKYSHIGFVDREGAFTEIASSMDLSELKAIHLSQGLDVFSKKELRLINIIQDLMRKGYKFQADSKFSRTDSLGKSVSDTTYYPVGPLAVYRGLRKLNANLWVVKEGIRIPISKFLEVTDMFDMAEQLQKNEEEPPEDKVVVEDGFVNISGVRLPVKEQ